MVNVNCTQENPPKNRIFLIRCSTEICDSQSYSSPWCAQLCNSNSHPDCLALGGSSCWWLFPLKYFFRFYREVSILTTSSLQQKIRIQDSIEISILLNCKRFQILHFGSTTKASWPMSKYGGDILVQFFATFCKHTIPCEEWMDWINFFCCNLAKRWCFAEEANIKYIFPIYDKNALKGDPRQLCPLISPLSFLNKSLLNIPPVYIIYSKSMMPLSNILVQAGLVVKPLNYLRLHWQLHFSTIPASLGNRRDKTYL